eukprot:scaffold216904_cov48-Prasinocladus_malaysianus.AAC.1
MERVGPLRQRSSPKSTKFCQHQEPSSAKYGGGRFPYCAARIRPGHGNERRDAPPPSEQLVGAGKGSGSSEEVLQGQATTHKLDIAMPSREAIGGLLPISAVLKDMDELIAEKMYVALKNLKVTRARLLKASKDGMGHATSIEHLPSVGTTILQSARTTTVSALCGPFAE